MGSDCGIGAGAAYWQASQLSGFSSEQAIACATGTGADTDAGTGTVALEIFDAGRERR